MHLGTVQGEALDPAVAVGPQDATRGRRVVVGVDGTPAAQAALRWAVREAALRDAAIDAVAVWNRPHAAGPGWARRLTAPPPDRHGPAAARCEHELASAAHAALEAALRPLLAASPGLEVTRVAVRGPAGATLVDVARHADLLVVGASRGGDGPGPARSVAAWCAAHAVCPVVIVPARPPLPEA